MPSVKRTVILLPLLGLVAAAPTNLPRDLGKTGDADTSVLDGFVHWPAGGSGNGDDEVDTGNSAIQRRSPQTQEDGTLTRGSHMAAEGTGSVLNFLFDTAKKFGKTAPEVARTFWGAATGKDSKRDVSSASVDDTASTLGKRRVPATQQGGYDDMDPAMPISPVAKPKSDGMLAGFNRLRTNNAEVRQKNAGTKLIDVQSKNAESLIDINADKAKLATKKDAFGLQQQKEEAKRKQKEWEAQNTPMGATKQRLTNWIAGSGANTANINSPPSPVGVPPAAPGSVTPGSGMPPTGRNPMAATPAGPLYDDETIDPPY
ncbi:hypothetical protein PspLS_10737 [Pyricularia sp. CBS 133598]|nr:hypothetical protein PspLS_10737 [Pyricularia sp. CBS 133598]